MKVQAHHDSVHPKVHGYCVHLGTGPYEPGRGSSPGVASEHSGATMLLMGWRVGVYAVSRPQNLVQSRMKASEPRQSIYDMFWRRLRHKRHQTDDVVYRQVYDSIIAV